jgi:hypothetical protein
MVPKEADTRGNTGRPSISRKHTAEMTKNHLRILELVEALALGGDEIQERSGRPK